MKIALIGNQNSGKTSLFNILTGSNQKVGNWPGVTIEKKSGKIRKTGDEVIDLPGIYSLSPYSLEEEVSRDFLLVEKPDLVINIIDGTCLERSLYLTTQLLETNIDLIVALNMVDLLEKEGSTIDIEHLSRKLQCTIIPISARKRTGIDELINTIINGSYIRNGSNRNTVYPNDVDKMIETIRNTHGGETLYSNFEAVKVFERDPQFEDKFFPFGTKVQLLETKYNMDSEELIADLRYKFIESIVNTGGIIVSSKRRNSFTTKIDKVLLNKWAAFPIFLLIMASVYFVAVGLMGTIPLSFIDAIFNGSEGIDFDFTWINPWSEWSTTIPFEVEGLGPLLARLIGEAGGAVWAQDLVATGLIGGVGAVLTFTPQILSLFFFLSILESSGYMSRIAFSLDRVFRYFGLNGQSIIPFIVGMGCGVPGIMACKPIEDENERKITAITATFVPCGAKLPIISLFVAFFFANFGWLVTLGVYLFGVISILIVAIFLQKVVFRVKIERSSYISELPTYKAPMMSYVLRETGGKTWDFIKKAGTIIVACSLIVWFLVSFTFSMEFVGDDPTLISSSMLAMIGHGLSWLFVPMMSSSMIFNGASYTDLWSISVSAIQGLIAKEGVVSAMNIIAVGNAETELNIFQTNAFSFMNGWTAVSFMAFNLFSSPCFAALGALKRELKKPREFWMAVGVQMGYAWVLGTVIGLIGTGVMAGIGG